MKMTVEQACNNIIDMMVQMKGVFAQQDAEIMRLREELSNVYEQQASESVKVDPVSEV
jgi:hypothetical protein